MKDFIKRTALEAGNILMQSFRNVQNVKKKDGAGYVTEADTKSEEFIINTISKVYPDHSILAEESGINEPPSIGRYKWIIDPLDGTTNFVHGLPWFCVSIACEFNGEIIMGTVYNPAMNELFFAEKEKGAYLNDKKIDVSKTNKISDSFLATGFSYSKGKKLDEAINKYHVLKQESTAVRRNGAAAIDLAYTAAGMFDGYWEKDISPWDMAAGVLIVKEAGGTITNFGGKHYTVYDKEVIASNGLIHNYIVNVLNDRKKDAISGNQ